MIGQMTFVYDTTSFDKPVWVVFYDMYMYGPCYSIEEVLYFIYNYWEDERMIVG